jgi:hypothetical protein
LTGKSERPPKTGRVLRHVVRVAGGTFVGEVINDPDAAAIITAIIALAPGPALPGCSRPSSWVKTKVS